MNLWIKGREPAEARLILIERNSNPNMIQFADLCLYFYFLSIILIGINFLLFKMGEKDRKPGKYLRHAHWCRILLFFIRIALMSYGIHFSWTAEQKKMREPGFDVDREEQNAAITIKPYIDALIWCIGLVAVVILGLILSCCCCCVALHGFTFITNNPHVQAKYPGAHKFITKNSTKYDPKDPAMKEGCVICMMDFSESDGKRVAQLACNHIFHEDCLKEWVKKH